MRIHDISVPLVPELPSWPGEKGLTRTLIQAQPDDGATVSHIEMGAHTGTHIDAPVHFIPGGSGIDGVDLEAAIGECFVADLRHITGSISAEDLETSGAPDDVERILALTVNSGWSTQTGFRSDYVAFDLSAAQWCVEREIRLVGNDYLSIEKFDTHTHSVHKVLLGANVVVLEGLDLIDVKPGVYQLIALPVLIPGSDGSSVRAVLVER